MTKLFIGGYVPPCTIWMRLEIEDVLLVASRDPIFDDRTIVGIERQSDANTSKWEGNNVIPDEPFDMTWE